jgi:hypothetical protein
MIYTNIQSLSANLNELKILMNEYCPKIVFLSESRQTSDILYSELEIDNYKLIRCDSENRRTGGCVIYLSNDIEFKMLKNEKIEKCWILTIKISKGFKPGVYGVIYKSPKQKKKKIL